jgi:hypothetical protein
MLQDDVNTSAGLHFMASVQKKAIGSQDASTNTDPGKILSFFFSFLKIHIF